MASAGFLASHFKDMPTGFGEPTEALEAPKICFLFAPVGWQRLGMGRFLYEKEGVFRKIVDGVADQMKSELPVDLRTVLYEKSLPSDTIDHAFFAQPALFAVETGLDALWRARGIAPDVLIGHSLGELAAACSGNGEPLFLGF